MTHFRSHSRDALSARMLAACRISVLAAAGALQFSSQAVAQNYPAILGNPSVTIDLGVLDALGPGGGFVPLPVYPPTPALDTRPPPIVGSRGLLAPPAAAPRSAFNPQARALLGLPAPSPQAGRILRRLPEPAAAPDTPAPQAAPRQTVRVQPVPPPRRADVPAVPPPPRMPSPQVAVPAAPRTAAPAGEAPKIAVPEAKPKAEPMVARAAPAPKVAAPKPEVRPVAGQPQQALAAPAPRVAVPAPVPTPMPRVEAQPPVPPPRVAAAPRQERPAPVPPPAPRVAAPAQPQQEVAAVPEPEAPPPAVAAAPAPQVAARPPAGLSSAGDRIIFAEGSAKLPDDAKVVLQGVISRLSDDEESRIQLLAYAEGTAETASQARRLSLSRALAVRSYLIEQGVRSTRMDVRALGNNFEDGPADRVDLVLVRR